MENNFNFSGGSEAELLQELKKFKLENTKLSRELRMTNGYLDKVKLTVEAKDVLGSVLAAASVKQRTYTDMLLESCPNIIILLDDAGRFVLFTKTFLRLTGLPNEGYIMDRTVQEVLSPLLCREHLDLIFGAIERVIAERETVTLNEYFDFGHSGNPRYYSIDFTIVEGKVGVNVGISAGVLAVFNDMTDFMREKERSEIANNAKSDFLAAMSHEIRTPLNAIFGMTEIVSRSPLNAQQQKYIQDIKTSSHSLRAIINEILDFSKIEAGKLDITNSDFDLTALLEALKAMFDPLYEAKGLRFAFHIAESLPGAVNGDENRLRQILTNLLSNALKYTVEGSVEFSARASGGMLRFDVADSGIGIREEDLPKLFMPFEQLDLKKNKNVVGTGLGLAISQTLCQMMGGKLSVSSVYGQGSTFSAEIPYMAAGAPESVREAPKDRPEEFTAPEAKILVVDDIEINLAVARAMLEIFGVDADTAQSGEDAIVMIRQKSYDIIFMDQMMPDMDGLEATRHIREMGGEFSAVPIIALTANAINGVERMFLSNGFNGFLAKPLELDALAASLKEWLPDELIVVPTS